MNLSTNQHQAVTLLDRPVCVSAGAGSGKTTVLAERYMHILKQENKLPENIIAITYTEKAAEQLKEKLIDHFMRNEDWQGVQRLARAPVTTIHGFAARLLREHPIEAGVDAEFQILDEDEAALLMEKTVEEMLNENGLEGELYRLLRLYSEGPLKLILFKFYACFSGVSETWFDPRMNDQDKSIRHPWFLFSEALNNFETGGSAAGKTAEVHAYWAKVINAKMKGDFIGQGMPWEHISFLESALKNFNARGKDKEAVFELREIYEQLKNHELRLKAKPVWEDLRLAYQTFATRFNAKKKELKALQFEDLMVGANRLMSGATIWQVAVQEELQRKYSHLLIDEFQDTNQLQVHWLTKIIPGAGLFVVGDEKQSIYLFRGADVSAFKKEKDVILERGGAVVELSENYRSRPEILQFVNNFFQKYWDEDNYCFVPLEAGRSYAPAEGPFVELIDVALVTKDDRLSMEEARILEAERLADRLVELKIGKGSGEVAGEKKYEWKDMAILFHAMNHSAPFEEALRRKGIPYTLAQGRGFYERQEIRDWIAYLELVDHPEKDYALATVLRSPIVGLSDDGIYWLATYTRIKSKDTPLNASLELLEEIVELADADREKLEKFKLLQTFSRSQKDRVPLEQWIEEAVTVSAYREKVLIGSGGERAFGNVGKLLEMARAFSQRGIFELRDFISYVREMIAREKKEAEAQSDTEDLNRVRLSTIHSAKGLEFPVVALANLGRKLGRSGGDRPLFLSSRDAQRAGLLIANPQDGAWHKEPLYQELEEEMQEEEVAEVKRVFYVGMTRAQERLILSGSCSGSAKGKDMTGQNNLMSAVKTAISVEPGENQIDWQGIQIRVVQEGCQQSQSEGAALDDKLEYRGETEIVLNAETSKESENIFFPLLEPMPEEKPYYETRDLSVTAVLQYAQCPGCYAERYEPEFMRPNLSAQELRVAETSQSEQARSVLPRKSFGILYHSAMEQLDFRKVKKDQEIELDASLLARLDPAGREEMATALRNFCHGPLIDLIAGHEHYKELDFLLNLRRGKISGQIDLVYFDAQRRATILDYKTGLYPQHDVDGIRQHELQLQLYGLALHEILGSLPAEGILYYTTNNQYHHLSMEGYDWEQLKECLEIWVEEIAIHKGTWEHRCGLERSE